MKSNPVRIRNRLLKNVGIYKSEDTSVKPTSLNPASTSIKEGETNAVSPSVAPGKYNRKIRGMAPSAFAAPTAKEDSSALPRDSSTLRREEFGTTEEVEKNDAGGALIITSFNKFIEDQRNAITKIDASEDGYTKAAQYTASYNSIRDKLGMYRQIFSDSANTLDSGTAEEGLELLEQLEDIYQERIASTSLPSNITTRAEYDTAVKQAGWYDKYSGMTADERKTALKRFDAQASGVLAGPSNFGEEQEWLKGYDEGQKLLEYDTEAAQAEIDELDAISGEYSTLLEQIKRKEKKLAELEHILSISPQNGGAIMDVQQVRGDLDSLYMQRDALGNYGDDINTYINEKRMYLKQAQDTQSLEEYEPLRENRDFAQKSIYDKSNAKGMYFLINSGKFARYDDTGRERYESKLEDDSSAIAYYKDRNYDMMNDDEIAMYNYLYITEGEKRAQDYLDALQSTLNERHAGMLISATDTTLEKLLFAAEAGVDQFSGGIRSIFDEQYALTPSSTQLASDEIRESMGNVGRFFYDAINTTANQLPTIITSVGLGFINPALGATAGTALMGTSAAGNGYAEMLRLGYTRDQAAAYGVLTGISEIALEKALGGISKLGGFSSKAITNMVKGIDNAAGRLAVQLGASAMSEATEEGLQSILEQTIIRNIALGESNGWSDIEWSEVAYSALLGGISGGIMEGTTSALPDVISEEGDYRIEGRRIIESGITDSVIALANDAVTELDSASAKRLSGFISKASENPTARNLGRLAYAINDTRIFQNTAEIQNTLVERGMSRTEAESVAERFSEIIEGDTFTKKESGMLDPTSRRYNEAAAYTARDMIYDPESSVYQRNREYSDVLNGTRTEDAGRQYKFDGYSEDGRGMYTSNFPKGTPKAAKSERILNYIQNVWSKNPISLKVTDENGNVKTILAEFDPTYVDDSETRTDATKLMGGNRHGTSSEQRVTLDLADDYYQLLEDSTYNYSRDETGKDTSTHEGVSQWHYFVNDILFAEHGSENYEPYRVSINIKEKADGNFVYSYSAEKEKPTTQRTLHAAVNSDDVTANGQFNEGSTAQRTLHAAVSHDENAITNDQPSDISISQPDGSVNTPYYSDSGVTSPEERARETRETAAANDISAEDVVVFERVAEEFGVSIVFGEWDPDVGGDGYYQNGTIYLNRNAYDPIAVVFAHELSHHAERAGWWNSYKDLALREMQRITGKDLSTLRAEVTELYTRHGKKLSTVGADAEIVAQFTQEHVLGSSEDLGRICEENPSLMQRVLDFIVDFLEKIGIINEDTRRIDRARRMLATALRDSGKKRGKTTGTVQYKASDSNNNSSIRQQLREHSDELSSMDPVADIVYTPTNKKALREMANEEFKKIGYKVDRQGFGVIEINEKHVNEGTNYLTKDGEYAALLSVPKVLKRGKIISGHTDHKGRSFGTVTIAAPVSINGTVGNVGVVVKMSGKNHYHTHRILMPDGSEFVFNKIDAELRAPDMLAENGAQRPGIHSASKNSIPQDPDGVKQYSFSRSAGSLDADTVAEAERMENEGYTEDEIYDAVGMWKDSETGRWMKDNDTEGLASYRSELEPELNDGRRNGVVADPAAFEDAIARAEQMEDAGKGSADIWEDTGLWRNKRTREWMTYDWEPRYAPYAGRLSDAEYAEKSKGFYEDQVDIYRDIAEQEKRKSEHDTEKSPNSDLLLAEKMRREISLARGDLTLDGFEYAIQEAISEELETEMYDVAEALTEAELARVEAAYILAESSGKQTAAVQDRNEAQFEAAEEARRSGEEYYFVRGNTGEITAEDEAFAYGGGEDLTEGVFNAIMEADTERRDSALASVISKSDSLVRNTKYGAKNYEDFEGELEVDAAKRDIATRTILRIVDDNGVIASRTNEISKYAGQIARGLYPMSKDSQYIYKMLVDQDKTDGSFANDIELYEDRLERAMADLEAAKQSRDSETEELISEAQKRIERYEKKLKELHAEREKYWNESEGKILDFVEDLSEVDLDEPYMYDWYLDSKNTALGDARFWFEYGAPAKELALNILAATDSLTEKTEREAIASKIAFLNREIKKQESHMDKGSISAAEKLAVEGYIESDSDDVHYLADLYRSIRALSSGEHSAALRNLSVIIDSPITSKYGTAAEFRMSAVRRDRLEREARRMAHKLTPGEKKIAKDIAEGNRLPSEIPQEFDSAKIMRFANLWKGYQSEISQSKNIQKFRARTAEEYRNSLKEMIGKSSIMKIGWFGTPKLNLLTPERAMRYAFGDTLGGKLADKLIYPIHRNEAERIRFINRLLKDFNSRFGKISKFESGHIQRLGESGATLELYDKGEIEARNGGYGYWEYAGMRRNEFKDVTAELLHRETLGHMERLNHDTISDSFWDALEKDLAATYTKELIDTRTAELKEKARVKHKETPKNISNGDMKKLTEEAWESARDEVSQLRDNETAYKSGDFSKKDIAELRKMVEETSPEDVLWNIKTELDEYAAEHIRKGDNSTEAKAERDSYVDREIRRSLMISDHMRQMYNMLFDGINDMLVSHGYDPVPFRRNYFPHIQPENTNGISKLLSSFGFHPEVTALPAQLAGRTEVFKPGHRWAPFMQRRVGNTTDFDAVKGFEGYLNYASDIIYHMDDIQKLRGFSTLIRTENSTDEIKAQVGKLQDNFLSGKITRQELDEKREDLLNKAKLTGDAGKFVTWLDDYTNVLAGKQAAFDRGIEHLLGRTALNAGQALQTIYTRSAVLGNLSSALMNFSQLPMGISIAGTKNMIRAMEDMVTGRLNDLYNFDERSDFLTGKKGVMKISQKGKMETWQDFLGGLFGATDDISVRLMQRALFYELVDSGMTVDEAIIRSDRLCQAIMASRTKGARPIAFESKNFFLRGATMFQLEIENSLSFVHEDLVHEMKEIHGKKWKTKLARTIITYLVAAWLLNMGFEEWLGKSPVPMDIIGIVLNTIASMFGSSQREIVHNILNGTGSSDDLEFKGTEGILDALAIFGKGIADDLPFISSVGQMLGVTEGRMPMLDFSPIWEDIGPGIYSAMLPKGATEEERDKARKEGLMDAGMGAIEIVKGLFPGGSQIYKTGMGIVSLVQGGVYDNSDNLKYPVERDTSTIVQGVLFGPNAMAATDEYYASGGRAYSEGETALIADLEATGMSMSEAADIIDLLDAVGAKDSDSSDDEEYTFTGDGYSDLKALLFTDDTDEDEPTAKEEALAAMKELGLTPEQKYLIYREKIASPKEVTLLDAIDYTGGDPVTSASVLMGMRECETKGDELQYLMDSEIDDIDAAMVFYGMLATEKERAAFDMLRDGQMEKSENIFLTLSELKRIENLTSDEVKAEGFAKKTAAKYDALCESPISESSKSAYYYEHLATENEKDALDELDKLDSDMSVIYSVVGDVRFSEDTGKQYGILIDSNITGDEQYAILKYAITSKNNRENLEKDIDDVIAAGGTVDDYLAAKEAVFGIESDKDRNGNTIRNSKSKKKLRAIREALPDSDYAVLVVLYEICGVSKSVYQKKNTGLLGSGGLIGSDNILGSGGLLGSKNKLGSGGLLGSKNKLGSGGLFG